MNHPKNCQNTVSTGQQMKPFMGCAPNCRCKRCSRKYNPDNNYVVNDFEPNALLITNGAGQVITQVAKYYIDPNDGSIHIVGDLHVETLYYDNLNPPVSGGGMFTHRLAAGNQTYQNNALIGLPPQNVKAWSGGMELMGAIGATYNSITGTLDFGYAPSEYVDIWAVTT